MYIIIIFFVDFSIKNSIKKIQKKKSRYILESILCSPILHAYIIGLWRNLDNMEGKTTSHTHTVHTQPYILPVSPPVVAVPWGATIIQPSVVKTESDVMRTVKQPYS